MREGRQAKSGRAAALLVVGLVVALGGLGVAWQRGRARPQVDLEGLPRSVVRRADIKQTLRAGGLVESAKQTLIECQLERLQVRSQGHAMNAGGSSTIISLIPDGTMVKKGDILCQLDSSDYEEVVRQQQLKVEESRSSKLMAQLDFDVAVMAVTEFQDGILKQTEQDYQGQVALAQSEVQRARDRLSWTIRMGQKGYASKSQISLDKATLQRADLALLTVKGEFENYRRFGAPIELRTLQSDVEAARSTLAYQTIRLTRNEERLEHYKRQVERCTIRAPHDGFVIYANDGRRNVRIEEGLAVYQKQRLFYLPDLANMQVQAVLHETVVDRVRDGMRARVHVESLQGVNVEGHITYIAPLPLVNAQRFGDDVKNYVGLVKLDSIPGGLKPGMSAEVEIVTGDHPDALVVPAEAVTIEGGHEFCYVASAEGIERREVTLGSGTPELLEVTEGLEEGEEVVLDPLAHNLVADQVTETPPGDSFGSQAEPGRVAIALP